MKADNGEVSNTRKGMKRFTPIIILIVLTAGCAKYPFEKWNKANTALQLSIAGVSAYDLLVQTPYYIKNDCELNPMLTDDDQVIPYYVSANIINFVAAGMLRPDFRLVWQSFWLGGHTATVIHNINRDRRYGRD